MMQSAATWRTQALPVDESPSWTAITLSSSATHAAATDHLSSAVAPMLRRNPSILALELDLDGFRTIFGHLVDAQYRWA